MKKHATTEQCYFIAHDPSVHYGELESGQEIVTGQNNLEIFDNEEEYTQRLSALGIELEQVEEALIADHNLTIVDGGGI